MCGKCMHALSTVLLINYVGLLLNYYMAVFTISDDIHNNLFELQWQVEKQLTGFPGSRFDKLHLKVAV